MAIVLSLPAIRLHTRLLALLFAVAAPCAFAQTAAPDPATSGVELQLLADTRFEHGFNLLGIRSIETGDTVMDVLNYGNPGAAPSWRLGQWGTTDSLAGAKPRVLRPGVFEYSNESKTVIADTVQAELTLAARASCEYAAPRKAGEEWPHLLVEQYLERMPYLKDLGELRVKLKVRLSEFHDRMTTGTYDPALHAAQLQIYLMAQNRDTSSPRYGDYLWFGMQLFDNRKDMPEEDHYRDGGKEDTTHKFIYVMPSKAFLARNLRDSEWATIDVDVLPYLKRAQKLAHAGGFLPDTDERQIALSAMHIGWELPGTFDVEARIRELQLIAITNHEARNPKRH